MKIFQKQERQEKEKNYHFIERHFGAFSGSLELPADIEVDNVKIFYKNGVLTRHLPKTKEQSSIKKIEVSTS